jgi:hypothetical protein
MNISPRLQRTVLYYPTILVPDSTWVRHAVLYWDQISSIVPERETDGLLKRPHMKLLHAEGQYRPVHPRSLMRTQDRDIVIHDLKSELKALLDRTDALQAGQPNPASRKTLIHDEKFNHGILGMLKGKGLVTKSRENWHLVEAKAAAAYMAMLAKYLALTDTNVTVPSTDKVQYHSLTFDPPAGQSPNACLLVRLHDVLPVPRKDVSLKDILAFKRKRTDELMQLRKFIDEFNKSCAGCSTEEEVRLAISQLETQSHVAVADLQSSLKDAKISTCFGCLTTLLDLKKPTVWLAAGALAAGPVNPAAWPVAAKMAAVGGVALIQGGAYWWNRRAESKKNLRESPVSYLFQARKSGIV